MFCTYLDLAERMRTTDISDGLGSGVRNAVDAAEDEETQKDTRTWMKAKEVGNK